MIRSNKALELVQAMLELVQAMLVMAAWYFPPDRFEDLRHYQYIHMAATMAMDVGLGEVVDSPVTSRAQSMSHGSSASVVEADSSEIERYRTILSCYLLCAGVSLSMDHPNMLKFTPFMERNLMYLKESPHAAPTDRKLAAWVELQYLSEEVADTFRRSRTAIVSFEDASIRKHIERLSQKFEAWWEQVDTDDLDDSLTIAYHYNKARIFEVVLHADHNLEDLRPPFLIRSGKNFDTSPVALTPAYIRVLFKLIHEVRCCIHTFLDMDLKAVRSAPVMHYIRCFYGLTVLLDLRVRCQQPNSDLSKVLEADTLQIEGILEKWRDVCSRAAGPEGCRSPTKFGLILRHVQQWLVRELSGKSHRDHGDLRPLTLLNAQLVALSRTSELEQSGTRDPSAQRVEPQAESFGVSRMAKVDTPLGWAVPCDNPEVGWNPLHASSSDGASTTGISWFNQSSFEGFVPMEIDQSAIAFFEGLSSNVARSLASTNFAYFEDGSFDYLTYQ